MARISENRIRFAFANSDFLRKICPAMYPQMLCICAPACHAPHSTGSRLFASLIIAPSAPSVDGAKSHFAKQNAPIALSCGTALSRVLQAKRSRSVAANHRALSRPFLFSCQEKRTRRRLREKNRGFGIAEPLISFFQTQNEFKFVRRRIIIRFAFVKPRGVQTRNG